MGWKDWPYWLKGGVIGLVFVLILFLLIYFNLLGSSISGTLGIFIVVITFIGALGLCPENACQFYTAGLLILLIESFIIGAIIGWIIGKIKNK